MSAHRRRSSKLLIQDQVGLSCLETRPRVREGLHGVPDLHHWDLAGSDEEYVFKKWLDLADVPEIWSSLQSPRGNSVGPTLRLDHSVSRRHAKVLVIRGTVSSGSSQLFGSTEAGNCYAGW